MPKRKKTRKFGEVKRRISPKDARLKQNKEKLDNKNKKRKKVRNVVQVPTAMFFKHNTQLGPPYRIIVDTNFINFSVRTFFSSDSHSNGSWEGGKGEGGGKP